MIDLIGKRYIFFGLSAIILIAGFIGFLVNGLQLDIQFQGGTLIQVQTEGDAYETAAVEKDITDATGRKVSVQKLTTYNAEDSSSRIHLMMLKVAGNEALSDKELNTVIDLLRQKYGVKADAQINVESVAPFIGKELVEKGLKATLIATILIIIYVWWRFSVMSGLSAAIMAIIALFHDAAIMLSAYTVFAVPLNDSFIAAVLTILGYSLNDTIIIYDRIRENNNLLKKVPIAELVNRSVVQTLSRSIITGFCTLIAIITIYIFASIYNIQSLKEFSLPLIIGIASGAYSSIFVASPLLVMWRQYRQVRKVSVKPATTR